MKILRWLLIWLLSACLFIASAPISSGGKYVLLWSIFMTGFYFNNFLSDNRAIIYKKCIKSWFIMLPLSISQLSLLSPARLYFRFAQDLYNLFKHEKIYQQFLKKNLWTNFHFCFTLILLLHFQPVTTRSFIKVGVSHKCICLIVIFQL